MTTHGAQGLVLAFGDPGEEEETERPVVGHSVRFAVVGALEVEAAACAGLSPETGGGGGEDETTRGMRPEDETGRGVYHEGDVTTRGVRRDGDAMRHVTRPRDSRACHVIYTSGTTGNPKV